MVERAGQSHCFIANTLTKRHLCLVETITAASLLWHYCCYQSGRSKVPLFFCCCFFVSLISSFGSILFISMSIFIVCLMLMQFSAKKKDDWIVKSAGVDPPGFKKWGGQDPPDPPVGDAPDWYHGSVTLILKPLLPLLPTQNKHLKSLNTR